jgi:hypothetical protein
VRPPACAGSARGRLVGIRSSPGGMDDTGYPRSDRHVATALRRTQSTSCRRNVTVGLSAGASRSTTGSEHHPDGCAASRSWGSPRTGCSPRHGCTWSRSSRTGRQSTRPCGSAGPSSCCAVARFGRWSGRRRTPARCGRSAPTSAPVISPTGRASNVRWTGRPSSSRPPPRSAKPWTARSTARRPRRRSAGAVDGRARLCQLRAPRTFVDLKNRVIQLLDLPLNLHGNSHDAFDASYTQRRDALALANALPVVPNTGVEGNRTRADRSVRISPAPRRTRMSRGLPVTSVDEDHANRAV